MSPRRGPRLPPLPEVPSTPAHDVYRVPPPFRPDRSTPAGRYRLLEVFRGLERTHPFRKYPGDDREVLNVARHAWATVVDGGGWMYVAPRRTPHEVARAGYRMITSRHDEIVVARPHLANSPLMDVYLDVIHEFLHILQRRQGRPLWPGRIAYADRPTEVEAYSFSIAEARRLGVPDSYLRQYLRVTWMNPTQYRRLLQNVGVSVRR